MTFTITPIAIIIIVIVIHTTVQHYINWLFRTIDKVKDRSDRSLQSAFMVWMTLSEIVGVILILNSLIK